LQYQAPERDAQFLLFEVFRVQDLWPEIEAFADLSEDLVRAVVAEGGRIATEVVTPSNQPGDEQACTWDDGEVATPDAYKLPFAEITGGGWLGLAGNVNFGGQGMPKMLACIVEEMLWAANTSLYLYGTLTIGSSLCIETHGTKRQQETYLPKMYAGQWTGAMALTESHAGTDLGIMRTKAEPQADGSYRISGTKVFITGGEHDLAENIIHFTWCWLNYPARQVVPRAYRCSSFQNSYLTKTAVWVRATVGPAVP